MVRTKICADFDIERFQAKWIPVRVKKTRQNNRAQSRFNSTGGFAVNRSNSSVRHCSARSACDEAIQLRFLRTLDCFAGLLRGACHRAALCADPLARNDVEGLAETRVFVIARRACDEAIQGRAAADRLSAGSRARQPRNALGEAVEAG